MDDDYRKIADSLIVNFEMLLRSFIKKTLSEKYGDWTKGIKSEMHDDWKRKQKSDFIKNNNMNEDLMIQASFSEYITIIVDNKWTIYEDIFGKINKLRLRVYLEELRDFRNKITHNKGKIESEEYSHHKFIINWFEKKIPKKYWVNENQTTENQPTINIDQAIIHLMVHSDEEETRIQAAKLLKEYFKVFIDKEQAWRDLYFLLEDVDVRFMAVDALVNAIPYIDKKKAWGYLHEIAQNGIDVDLSATARVIGLLFPDIPDKLQAWQDLIKLTHEEDIHARHNAIVSLGSAFFYMPDKMQSWDDIFPMIKEKDKGVWNRAWIVLYNSFQYIPNKEKGYNDIYKLTMDNDTDVRVAAIKMIGEVYPYIPTKEQVDTDLWKLMKDANLEVRCCAREINDRNEIYSKMKEGLSKVSKELK